MDVNLAQINAFLSGAVMLGFFLAGLFFLRFWGRTRDRLFLLFAISFGVMGVQRIALLVSTDTDERAVWLYGLRLVAFLLIIGAIVDKNRAASPRPPRGPKRQRTEDGEYPTLPLPGERSNSPAAPGGRA